MYLATKHITSSGVLQHYHEKHIIGAFTNANQYRGAT
jgi:hypothetical protein